MLNWTEMLNKFKENNNYVQALDLSARRFTVSRIEELRVALAQNTHLTEVNLSGWLSIEPILAEEESKEDILAEEEANNIKLLNLFANVKKISLNKISFSYPLSIILGKFNNLTSLSIAHIQIKQPEISMFELLFASLPQLIYLDISCLEIKDNYPQYLLIDNYANYLLSLTRLQTLVAINCPFILRNKGIQVLNQLTALTAFNISNNKYVQSEDISSLATYRSLRHLTARKIDYLDAKGIKNFKDLINLSYLDMGENVITLNALAQILNALSHLNELKIDSSYLNAKQKKVSNLSKRGKPGRKKTERQKELSFISIYENMKPHQNLTFLDISNCLLFIASWKYLFEKLPHLKHLNISETNNILEVSLEGASNYKTIFYHLSKLKNLTTLIVSKNKIRNNDLEALIMQPQLFSLDLSYNLLDISGLDKEFIERLATASNIKLLKLSGNKLLVADPANTAKNILQSTTLTSLNIANTGFSFSEENDISSNILMSEEDDPDNRPAIYSNFRKLTLNYFTAIKNIKLIAKSFPQLKILNISKDFARAELSQNGRINLGDAIYSRQIDPTYGYKINNETLTTLAKSPNLVKLCVRYNDVEDIRYLITLQQEYSLRIIIEVGTNKEVLSCNPNLRSSLSLINTRNNFLFQYWKTNRYDFIYTLLILGNIKPNNQQTENPQNFLVSNWQKLTLDLKKYIVYLIYRNSEDSRKFLGKTLEEVHDCIAFILKDTPTLNEVVTNRIPHLNQERIFNQRLSFFLNDAQAEPQNKPSSSPANAEPISSKRFKIN